MLSGIAARSGRVGSSGRFFKPEPKEKKTRMNRVLGQEYRETSWDTFS